MNTKSPMFIFNPDVFPFFFMFPVSELIKAADKCTICMNCQHFHQFEDWREVPEGFYLPKGECHCHAPAAHGFPKVHGGQKCGDFNRKKQEDN